MIMKMDGTRILLGTAVLMIMTMSSVTVATHNDAENAVPAAAATVVTAAASSSTLSSSLSSSYVHVTIEATCSGVDWHKIPLSQDIFVGNELQRTFNEVHGNDEHLVNVKFEPMGKSFFGWTGDYNCLSCIRDDTLHAQWESAFASALATSDHKDVSKVRKCKITMKAPMMMMRQPAVAEEPSQDQEQTSTLTTMKESAAAAVVVNIIENAVHVEITAYCTGVDFATLPIAANVAAGHALQDSFNTAYIASDKRLGQVEYGRRHYQSSSGGLEFYYGWNGSYGCISCRRWRRNDDDDFIKHPRDNAEEVDEEEEEEGDPLLHGHAKEWETEFANLLVQSGMKQFGNVKDCSIRMMKADPGVEEQTTIHKNAITLMIPSKCGLRGACAEN